MLLKRVLDMLPRLWGNWISLLGTTVATVAGNAFLILMVVDIVTGGANQYTATFGYLMMPPLFVLGLGLVALGVWREHRRRPEADTALDQAVRIVLQSRQARRRVAFVIVASVVNVTLVSVAAFEGIHYMDSPRFCGTLCHAVMKPEYQAYVRSPHARVACVDCHIGPGTSWFVRSKLSGLRQVWSATTGRFSRPIPTPVHNLRPARETCEACHWPAKFHGERTLVRHVYRSDQENSRVTDVVRLNVGGVNRRTGRFVGIHWHVGPDTRIEYEALDGRRAKIGNVTLVEKGQRTAFVPTDGAARRGKVVERRVMDCVDCHNRPTHIYDPSPERAVDEAFALGKLDASLPFLRREAISILQRTSTDPEGAPASFTAALEGFYRKSFAEVARTKAASISKAGSELAWIYRRNIFPDLKIAWGTYPSHLGHRQTTEGCFRCHDDGHKSAAGKTIAQDCDLCHEVLAEESDKPDVPETTLRLGGM
jgi:hypothetical protein